MDGLAENVNDCALFLKKNLVEKIDIGVVMGSGLGGAASLLDVEREMAYEEITHFPVSSVKGHAGKMALARIAGKTVLVLMGRFHYYEGYTMRGVTFPIRVLSRLGAKTIILTNAAGGLNRRYRPGDFMLVTDHINLMGDNPLIGVGENSPGPTFVDMRGAYAKPLIDDAADIARRLSIKMHKGVLVAVSGPSYETKAEAGFLVKAGADAVTMSTVPETIVARQEGMDVLAVSCITNTLWQNKALGHEEVVDVAGGAAESLAPWLREIIRKV